MTPTFLDQLRDEIASCRQCVAFGYPVFSKPIFSVSSSATVMTVGQSPGRHEAETTGQPFSGPAGRRLFRWLAEAGFGEDEFRSTQAMSAITLCYPGRLRSGRGDRVPSRAEQTLCGQWLERLIAIVQPRLVLPIGSLAIARFLGRGRKLNDCVGAQFPIDGRTIIPLPHPSGASLWFNDSENQARLHRALRLVAESREAILDRATNNPVGDFVQPAS